VAAVTLGTTSRNWRIAAVAVIALSVFLHLWQLGLRALAHDEAIDANFSWQARNWGVMKYDPVYHGPLRFYLEGFVLDTFGTSAGWTRVVAAVSGIAATVAIVCSVRLLGRVGALAAALLFTISPTALTVTRTGREDSLTCLVALGLLLVVGHALVEPRARHIVACGALLAASFTLKETTFILGFAGFCFFAGLALVAGARPDGGARRFFQRVGALGRDPWMWSTVVFVVAFLVVFTSGFRYGEGFRSGLVDGIRYWWSQHEVGRGSQRWFFYGTIYIGYEWLILTFAAAGLAVTVRRRSLPGAWFATMAAAQFALFSWAGEKFAWLALHPLVPAVLLAGVGADAVWARLSRTPDAAAPTSTRWLVAAAFGLVAAATVAIAIPPAITDGADPRELLVTVQTSDAVPKLAERLRQAQDDGQLASILIDQRDSGSWPWSWYVHGMDGIAYITLDPTQPLPPGYDAYIVSASTPPPPIPAGYEIERFPLRVWWLPDYGTMSPLDAVRWLLTRRVWSPTASSDQYLIIRSATG
jgi:uncharacterized protein (TIGR03663 family)